MALITSQQLTQYYDLYMNIDVTFTKQVTRAIGLKPQQTFLRFLGYQLPCIVYSSSMVGAKIIASIKPDLYEKIRDANNLVSLRFCFQEPDKQDSLTFFVGARISGFNPYSKEHPDLSFVTLSYTQRPSDDLISTLGQLLEANINAKRRKEERIDINPATIRKMGMTSKSAVLLIDGAPCKCILRDISFSGAKVLISGVADQITDKQIKLRIAFDDGKKTHVLPGKIVRFDEFEEQKGIGAAGILFDDASIPMEYKMHLNEYLISVRKPHSDSS